MSLSLTTENSGPKLSALPTLGGQALLAGLALAFGLLIARLPLIYSLAIVGGSVLLIAALLEPLVGLLTMLAIGLAEPLLAAAGLLPVPYSQVIFLLFAGAWLARGIIKHEIRWPSLPITIFFFIYLVACALSVYFHQPVSPKDAATELWKWAQMYIIAGIVYDTAGRQKLGWVLAIVLGVGLIEAGIGLWQFQFRGHGPAGFEILGNHYRAYGTLEQPNPFGGFMGIVWPIAAMLAVYAGLTLFRRLFANLKSSPSVILRSAAWSRFFGNVVRDEESLAHPINELDFKQLNTQHSFLLFITAAIIAVATLGALFLSFSRGSWLGAVAAAGVMLIFWPKRRWLGVALAGGGLIAFLALYQFGLLPASISNRFADVGDFLQVYDVRGVHINDTNFAIVERLAHWQAAVNMANAQPLFGVGFGNYNPSYQTYRLAAWQYGLGHAHNIYLNVLAETGVVGLIAYLIFWLGIVALTIRAISQNSTFSLNRALAIGLLGCWVHLATHQILDNLYVGNIPLYLGALFGILCIILERPTTPNQNQLSTYTDQGTIDRN
jgi:putative inorganic carbon (hco3(-)) transporter